MNIIYPHPMVFPNKMAHSIQIIHTCWELASRDVKVNLLVAKLDKKSIKECLQVYGIPELENLSIYGPKEKSRRIYFYLMVFREIWRHRGNKDAIVFLRDKKLARLLLLFKWLIRIPCIFESHALTYLVHQHKFNREKPDRPLKGWFKNKLRVRRYYRLERYIYKKADGIICQTAGLEKEIRKTFHVSAPVDVIYSGTWLKGKKVKQRGQDILYLGQLYPQKGTDILIESLRYLPDKKLIIIGGNKERDVLRTQRLCKRFGVYERVVLTGYIEPREIETYFNRIGVAVIPILDILETRLFTSPLKLFDYMASKIPIVASDLPSMREILKNGETAILVEPNNPKKLAEGINLILSDETLAQNISEQAYRKAMEYSYGKRAEKIMAFIDNILAIK